MSDQSHRTTDKASLFIYSCIVSLKLCALNSSVFWTSQQIKDNCFMQNSLNSDRLHFPRGLLRGDYDMIMIATHDCVSEQSVVKSRFRHSGHTVESNPLDYHAMVVRTLKAVFGFLFFLFSPCFLVLKSAEKPTTIVLNLSQNEKPEPFEHGRELQNREKRMQKVNES